MENSINYQDLKAVFAISATVIFYYIYHYLSTAKSTHLFFARRWKDNAYYVKSFLFNKVLGFLVLGIIPTLLFIECNFIDFSELGISFQKAADNLYWLIGLPIIVIIVNFFTARNPKVYAQYPQMRISIWTLKLFLVNSMGWSLYLVGYEFLFRGLLLILSEQAFGVWPAVVVNIAIYSAVHMSQGMKEAIAAIPFGFILCFFMLDSGTLLIPIVLHIGQSLSNDFFSIKFNPEMSFIKTK